MIHIKEAIVVEGRYDKNTLSQLVDTLILTTEGFHNLQNDEFIRYLRQLAEERGLIILTDSDYAGMQIRNKIAGMIQSGRVLHAYIPEIQGKENRKKKPGKEGLLGVEGMTQAVLRSALERAGSTSTAASGTDIKPADFYEMGLTGTAESAELRRRVKKYYSILDKVNTKTMMKLISEYTNKEELRRVVNEIREEYGL